MVLLYAIGPPIIVLISATIFGLFRYFRTKFSYRVNCWFCNDFTRVPYQFLNNWTCSHCEQYNGFTENGDYNLDLPEQRDHRLNRRFIPPLNVKKEPDLTHFDPPNGLCNQCNDNQAVKIRLLRHFSPLDEARYDQELKQYKSRIDKAYCLCSKCEQFVENTLIHQSHKLKLFEGLGRNLRKASSMVQYKKTKTKIWPSKYGLSIQNKQTQRALASTGLLTQICHITNTLFSLLMTMTDLYHLQIDSQNEACEMLKHYLISLDRLPIVLLHFLPRFYQYCITCSLLCVVVQMLAMHIGKARLVLPDLLILPCWFLSILLHSHRFSSIVFLSNQDLFLSQTACSCLISILSLAIALLPRKKKRKSTRKFVSAFSVASTPSSQCSSARQSLSSCSLVEDDGLRQRNARETTPSRDLGRKFGSLNIGPCVDPFQFSTVRNGGGPFSSLSFNASTYKSAVQSRISRSTRFSPCPTQFTGYDDSASMLTSASQLDSSIEEKRLKSQNNQFWCNCFIISVVLLCLSTNLAVLYFVLSMRQ